MRTIEFELPKTLHNDDVFQQELRLDKAEQWYGLNQNIHVTSKNEYNKINKIAVFVLCFGSESSPSLLTIPISFLPSDIRIFRGKNSELLNPSQSIYDLSMNKMPLKIHEQEQIIFKLFINFKDKKYIKFKKEPIVFINIFSRQE